MDIVAIAEASDEVLVSRENEITDSLGNINHTDERREALLRELRRIHFELEQRAIDAAEAELLGRRMTLTRDIATIQG